MGSLERELHTVKHELSTTRESLTNEKMNLHRQVEELEQKLKLTEAANNSEKVCKLHWECEILLMQVYTRSVNIYSKQDKLSHY